MLKEEIVFVWLELAQKASTIIMHLCKELSCAVHRLTRAVQMYWLAHLASASSSPGPSWLVGARLGAQIAL